MPFPRSRLDAYLVFLDTTLPPNSLQNQFHQWCLEGYILNNGERGENYKNFGFGIFKKMSVIYSEEPMLFANHQGGYRVFCPNIFIV